MTARIIYSTGVGSLCPNCRRPVRECVCPKGAPGAAKPAAVRVGREIKGRAGKGVTTITGLPMTLSDIESLAAKLKNQLPKLQDNLLKRGWQVIAIRLKVQVIKEIARTPIVGQAFLPVGAVSAFSSLENALEETPQNRDLKAALRALVEKRRGG